MKKLVKESIGFERGGDPRRSMNVGKLERLKKKYGRDSLDGMLKSASLMGDLVDVKFLVQQGVDIQSKDNWPLRSAVEYGHLDVVKYLIEQGADIRDSFGYTLRFAARNCHLDVVKYLIEKGEKIGEKISYHNLVIASGYASPTVKEYLKSKIKE